MKYAKFRCDTVEMENGLKTDLNVLVAHAGLDPCHVDLQPFVLTPTPQGLLPKALTFLFYLTLFVCS